MALDAVSLMRARGARNSILAGARPRDRIRWRRPVRSPRLKPLADGAGHTFLKPATVSLSLAGWRGRALTCEKASCFEDLADRALVVSEAEALGHDLLQVHPAPAHDSMRRAPGRFQRPRRAAPAAPPRGAAGGLSTSCP